MRLTKENMGEISITPDKKVIAGEYSTWTIIFKAGKYGIDNGGSLVIAWKSVSDWDIPQFDEPNMPGYTTVSTDGQCKLKAKYAKFVRPFGNSILINVKGGYIKKDDTIKVVLGDTSQGSLGMIAQSFCEREHEIRVYLNPCRTGRYEEMPQRLKLQIIPSYHHEIQAIVPGSVRIGDTFDISIRALDEFGNPTGRYKGDINLKIAGVKAAGIPEHIEFPEDTEGIYKISGCSILEEGFWNLRIEDKRRGYIAYSNASKCISKYECNKLYWGDMHGQTRETVGTGMLDDYYAFARDKACIDFTGWQGNDFEISDETWRDIRNYTRKYNEEGKFLAYLGYEWSGITPEGGDHNVYFLDDNADFFPSSNWTATSVDPVNNAYPITELFHKLGDREDVMLIPHVGGRYANLDYLNRQYTSVIEIHSHHGTFEWFAFDAMKRRLKVGFIAASDDHTCRPGLSYPLGGHGKSSSLWFDVANGFTGVFAEELTKKAVWNAIKARHCYASTFDRIYLNTSVGELNMGDEGTINGQPALNLEAAGNFPIERFEVYDWEKKIYEEDCLGRDNNRIRIRWGGVASRGFGKSHKWDGFIYVQGGKIANAEKYAFDRTNQGIVIKSDKYIQFTSSTSGDYDGIILDIEGDDETVIKFNSAAGTVEATYREITENGYEKAMGGLNLKIQMELAYEGVPFDDYPKCNSIKEKIGLPKETGEHAYWVRILQSNGNAAWSSPIFARIQ